MIYLASPYTNDSKEVEHKRFVSMCHVTGKLQALGYHVFSPIVHSHPIAKEVSLPTTSSWWMEYNIAWIDVCKEVWIVMLPGWDQSKGVASEIRYCQKVGKLVRYFDPTRNVFSKTEKPQLEPIEGA